MKELEAEKLAYLKANFANTKNSDLVAALGITTNALHTNARKYGLTKSAEFMRQMQMAGIEAANKVRKKPPKGYIIPNSEKYRFKKGHSNKKLLTPERYAEMIQKSTETRKATIKAERRRIMFGLPQKTKLKLVKQPRAKVMYRYLMRRLGYIELLDQKNVLFYNRQTCRSEKQEQNAARHSIRIKSIDDKREKKAEKVFAIHTEPMGNIEFI